MIGGEKEGKKNNVNERIRSTNSQQIRDMAWSREESGKVQGGGNSCQIKKAST